MTKINPHSLCLIAVPAVCSELLVATLFSGFHLAIYIQYNTCMWLSLDDVLKICFFQDDSCGTWCNVYAFSFNVHATWATKHVTIFASCPKFRSFNSCFLCKPTHPKSYMYKDPKHTFVLFWHNYATYHAPCMYVVLLLVTCTSHPL